MHSLSFSGSAFISLSLFSIAGTLPPRWIFINTDRQVVLGRIDFVTNGVAVMAEEQLAAQKDREKKRKKEENRQEWEETDFYGKMFLFDNIVIEDITVNGPNLNITDSEGNIHPNTEVAAILAASPEKTIIIEDKNGDQWAVEKDGNVSKRVGNSGIEDVVPDNEARKDKGYYIMAEGDTTKYKTGGNLVYIRQKSKVKITLGSEVDTLKAADLKWKIDGKEVCKGKAEYETDLSKDGNYKIEILAGADKVLKLNLDIYKKPVVKFERDGSYKGEYGPSTGLPNRQPFLFSYRSWKVSGIVSSAS